MNQRHMIVLFALLYSAVNARNANVKILADDVPAPIYIPAPVPGPVPGLVPGPAPGPVPAPVPAPGQQGLLNVKVLAPVPSPDVPAPVPGPVPAPVPAPGQQELVCGDAVIGSTVGASIDLFPGLESGAVMLPLYVEEDSKTLDISTCLPQTDFPTALYLLPPDATDLSEAVCSNEGLCGPDGDHAEIDNCDAEPGMYNLVVTGSGTQEGNFEMLVVCHLTSVEPISCGDIVEGNTEDGLVLFPDRDDKSIIYILNLPWEFTSITASTCFSETDFDAVLVVAEAFYEDEELGGDILCSSNNNNSDSGCGEEADFGALVEECSVEPGIAALVVTAGEGATGNFKLSLECQ